MCGIVGILDFDRAPGPGPAAAMAELIAHRGPDDAGVWAEGPIALGHRRLSIIDLSPDGHQPMRYDGGLAITYNGEIYNYRELRRALAADGCRFRTQSDTEVILAAYRAWGVDCLSRLNGIFGFALWDPSAQRLFCARDRLGVKPLYYRAHEGRFGFASEAKALLAGWASGAPGVDPDGLANYLAFGHAVGAQTIWRGIRKLLPGHYMVVDPTGLRERRYWDVEFAVDARMTADEATEGVRARLERAVRRQMVADVPVGAFLSGGVDSSAIVALMARCSAAPVKTFAVGFVDGGAYNELAPAAAVARHVGSDHHEIHLRSADLPDLLDRLVWHYDEPFADAAAFPLLVLAEAARRHVKVVLTGEGGDELFGGYRRFAFERFSATYQRVPGRVRGMVEAGVSRLPRARRAKQALRAMGVADQAARAGEWLVVFDAATRRRLVRTEVAARGRQTDPLATYRACHDSRRDLLGNLLYADIKTWLPDAYMEKVDKATMAVGLEARVPLLDHELVEFAATIPSEFKIRGRAMKWVLKRAVADLLPPGILTRPKHGFAVPTDSWLRGPLADYAHDLLAGPGARSRAYFIREEVVRLLEEHRSGRNLHDTRLWTLLNFELWLRQAGRREVSAAPVAVAAS